MSCCCEDRALNLDQFETSMVAVKEYIDKQQKTASGALSADLPVSKTVGGVGAGIVLPEGKTFEDIFIEMFNPVTHPALTNPSAKVTASGSTLFECGEERTMAINIEFNRGAISPANGTSGFRTGPATGYILNGGEEQDSPTFSMPVSETNNTFTGIVKFSEGEQPKDSSGEDYGEPYPAGQISASQLTFEFVNAIWSNAKNNSEIVKEALLSKSAKTKTFIFDAQTASTPEVFDVPSDWNITSIEVLNELSGKFDDCSSEFKMSNVIHQNASGVDVNYKRYSDIRGYAAAERTIKITWN